MLASSDETTQTRTVHNNNSKEEEEVVLVESEAQRTAKALFPPQRLALFNFLIHQNNHNNTNSNANNSTNSNTFNPDSSCMSNSHYSTHSLPEHPTTSTTTSTTTTTPTKSTGSSSSTNGKNNKGEKYNNHHPLHVRKLISALSFESVFRKNSSSSNHSTGTTTAGGDATTTTTAPPNHNNNNENADTDTDAGTRIAIDQNHDTALVSPSSSPPHFETPKSTSNNIMHRSKRRIHPFGNNSSRNKAGGGGTSSWSRGSLRVQAHNMLHGTLDPDGGVEVVFYDCYEYENIDFDDKEDRANNDNGGGGASSSSHNNHTETTYKVDFRRDSVVLESIRLPESSRNSLLLMHHQHYHLNSLIEEDSLRSEKNNHNNDTDHTDHTSESIEISRCSPSSSAAATSGPSPLTPAARLWTSVMGVTSNLVGGGGGGTSSPQNTSVDTRVVVGGGGGGGIESDGANFDYGEVKGDGGNSPRASDSTTPTTSPPNPPYPPPPPPPTELPLRFLRAGKGDPEEGLRRYEATLLWRQEENIDTLLREPNFNFDLIKANYPHFFAGKGRLGEPVFYERPPKTDLKALKDGGVTLDTLLRHYIMVSEFQWQYLERDDLQRSVYIIDLEGIRLGDFVGEVVDFVKRASTLSAQHYPERAGYVFVINVPAWFKLIWSVVKPLVDESTLDKIYILRGAEEIRQNMLERIPMEYIPADYGGDGPPLGESDEEKEFRALIEHNNAMATQGGGTYCPCPKPCRFCTWQQPRSY